MVQAGLASANALGQELPWAVRGAAGKASVPGAARGQRGLRRGISGVGTVARGAVSRWTSFSVGRDPLEHLFDALLVASRLLTGEMAARAVFNRCGVTGFGPRLGKRLRLPSWAVKALWGIGSVADVFTSKKHRCACLCVCMFLYMRVRVHIFMFACLHMEVSVYAGVR